MVKKLELKECKLKGESKKGLRIIHTADWHLGGKFYSYSLEDVQNKFLESMAGIVKSTEADVLLVVGDLFDTKSPSGSVQEMYYQFLNMVRSEARQCRHIVILGGNHDPAKVLDAPQRLLRHFKIHVMGRMPKDVDDAILELTDENGQVQALLGCVPYLHTDDLPLDEVSGESVEDSLERRRKAMHRFYDHLWDAMLKRQEALGLDVPLMLSGHLPIAGAILYDDQESRRDGYVGNVLENRAEIFSSDASYVALGHLHRGQSLGAGSRIRYSGSPMPMGFGELGQEKSVVLLEVRDDCLGIESVALPEYLGLIEVEGEWDEIEAAVESVLQETSKPILLKLSYTGEDVSKANWQVLRDRLIDTRHAIVFCETVKRKEGLATRRNQGISLSELSPQYIFDQLLKRKGFSEEKSSEWQKMLNEAIELRNKKNDMEGAQ